MNEAQILSHTFHALVLVLILSLPPIVVAAVTGLGVSLFQAITQVQEQTISFAVKLIAVIATIVFTARWLGGEIYNFTLRIFNEFWILV